MIAIDSSWSGLPQAPNIIAPRQSGLTFMPVRPSVRYCMIGLLELRGAIHVLREVGPAAAGRGAPGPGGGL